MNLYKKFVKDNGLKADYIKWLENMVNDNNATTQLFLEKDIKMATTPQLDKIALYPSKEYETEN